MFKTDGILIYLWKLETVILSCCCFRRYGFSRQAGKTEQVKKKKSPPTYPLIPNWMSVLMTYPVCYMSNEYLLAKCSMMWSLKEGSGGVVLYFSFERIALLSKKFCSHLLHNRLFNVKEKHDTMP